MKVETYFQKFGRIYGISYKNGGETGYSVWFSNLDDAREWLNTSENDFRTRELCSKSEALKFGRPSEIVRVEDTDQYSGETTASRLERAQTCA